MTKFPVLDEGYFGNSSSSSTQSQEVQPEKPQQNPPPLDERCFSSFAPLIKACQDYATLSGCRFSIRAFDGIDCEPGARLPIVSDKRAQDAGPLLSAKLQAVSSVRSFAKRIRSGELDLIQDLTRAFDIVTQESARNSMIASCKAADVFPPLEHTHVDEQDCSWDAVGATSVLVIAQRLYNDEVHRLHDIVDGRNLTLVRAKTASFVVEFADEVGVGLPQMPTDRTDMLEQFQQDLTTWTAGPSRSAHKAPISAFLQNTGDLAAHMAKNEKQKALFWGIAALSFGAVGVAAHVGANIARSSARPGGAAPMHFPHQVRV